MANWNVKITRCEVVKSDIWVLIISWHLRLPQFIQFHLLATQSHQKVVKKMPKLVKRCWNHAKLVKSCPQKRYQNNNKIWGQVIFTIIALFPGLFICTYTNWNRALKPARFNSQLIYFIMATYSPSHKSSVSVLDFQVLVECFIGSGLTWTKFHFGYVPTLTLTKRRFSTPSPVFPALPNRRTN